MAFPVEIKIDINDLLQQWRDSRKEGRFRKEMDRRVREATACHHIWTIFDMGVYSQCSVCGGYISTTLLHATKGAEPEDEKRVQIGGTAYGMYIKKLPQDAVITRDPYGGRPLSIRSPFSKIINLCGIILRRK